MANNEQDVKTNLGGGPSNVPKSRPPRRKSKQKFSKVKEISPNELNRGWNLVVRAVSEPVVQLKRTYLDGTQVRVSTVLVGDSTGVVALHLKDDQVDAVKKGDTLILRNVALSMSDLKIFVRVDQWGVIEKVDSEQFDVVVKENNNVSNIEWELVNSNEVQRE